MTILAVNLHQNHPLKLRLKQNLNKTNSLNNKHKKKRKKVKIQLKFKTKMKMSMKKYLSRTLDFSPTSFSRILRIFQKRPSLHWKKVVTSSRRKFRQRYFRMHWEVVISLELQRQAVARPWHFWSQRSSRCTRKILSGWMELVWSVSPQRGSWQHRFSMCWKSSCIFTAKLMDFWSVELIVEPKP